LAVLAIGGSFTVDHDVFQAHASGLKDFQPTLPSEMVAKMAERHGIPVVSVIEPLRELANESGTKVYNPPSGSLAAHLEPQAEVVVGQVAADMIVGLFGTKTEPRAASRGLPR
jgi:hypothetical protein